MLQRSYRHRVYRRLHLRHNQLPYELGAVNLKKLMNYGGFILLQGRMEKIGDGLFRGEGVLVSEVFSNRSGLSLGDRYRAQVGEVVLDLPILGVFRDYRTNGGAVYMDLKAYQSMTGDTAWGASHPSSWRAKNLFLAHVALSDVEDGRFYWDEDVAREAVGLAGVRGTGE